MRKLYLRRSLLAFSIAGACTATGIASAVDITVTPPPGGGFVIAGGDVTFAGLPAAGTQNSTVCFNAVTGLLGACAPGSSIGPTGPTGPTGATGATGATGPGGTGIDGAEVALAVHKLLAHGPRLRHVDERGVDHRLAVR